MRKVISLIVFGALCVALFSSPAQALGRDPKILLSTRYSSSGDDGGWDDPATGLPGEARTSVYVECCTPAMGIGYVIFWYLIDRTTQADGLDSTSDETAKRDPGANTE